MKEQEVGQCDYMGLVLVNQIKSMIVHMFKEYLHV